jgi:glucose-1-phosphate cytidylyltransferase
VTAPLNKDTPVIVLCGGQGTRIRDAAEHIPKPMLQIGGYPILWHILRIYAAHGYRNFILARGYKSWLIKEYFLNYRAMTRTSRSVQGAGTMRILVARATRLADRVCRDRRAHADGRRVFLCRCVDEFMVTYGDGVADIDITRLHAFHRDHHRTATVTGSDASGRFGSLVVDGPSVVAFNEHRRRRRAVTAVSSS